MDGHGIGELAFLDDGHDVLGHLRLAPCDEWLRNGLMLRANGDAFIFLVFLNLLVAVDTFADLIEDFLEGLQLDLGVVHVVEVCA